MSRLLAYQVFASGDTKAAIIEPIYGDGRSLVFQLHVLGTRNEMEVSSKSTVFSSTASHSSWVPGRLQEAIRNNGIKKRMNRYILEKMGVECKSSKSDRNTKSKYYKPPLIISIDMDDIDYEFIYEPCHHNY